MAPLWLAVAFAFATGVAISGLRAWPWELFSHFRPHLIAVGVVLAAGFGLTAHYTACALAALSVAANALTFPKLRYRLPAPQEDGGLCVLWANLWKRERALAQTIAYARRQGADILLFSEFPNVGADWLERHADEYKHVLISDFSEVPHTSRVVIMSKRPLEQPQTFDVAPLQRRPMQTALVRCGEQLLSVSAVHPAAPGSPQLLAARDAAIPMIFERQAAPALVAGDFNATLWCPALRNAPIRIGNPITESTWLTRWPVLGLPIDHIFITEDVRVSSYSVGPFLGSDHRALVARVRL